MTNVPGPQFPLYLQGARLLELYPQVPLMESLGIGIALASYDGLVHWGFNSDPDVVPDADVFVEQIRASYARVAAAAKLVGRDAAARSPAEKGKPIRPARSREDDQRQRRRRRALRRIRCPLVKLRNDWERNLGRLRRQLPAPLARMLRDLVRNLREAQRQLETARAERDVRWQKLQTQLRSDAARLLRQLEKASSRARRKRVARARGKRTRATGLNRPRGSA